MTLTFDSTLRVCPCLTPQGRCRSRRPRCYTSTMKVALAIAAVLLLSGCGHASAPSTGQSSAPHAGQSNAPHDPFVGTWRVNLGDRVRWVIRERSGRYWVTQGRPGDADYRRLALLTRYGDQLSGKMPISTHSMATILLRIGNVPGQLLLTFYATNMATPIQTILTKLSDSTATPTPVP